MKFNINEWRQYYQRIKAHGQQLCDSRVTRDKHGKIVPAIKPLTQEELNEIESNIKILTKKLTNYLNNSQLKYAAPLWKYSTKDETTWSSHESFKFEHLLQNNL